MADYVERLWLVPALAVAADVTLLLAMCGLPRRAASVASVVQDAYGVMFWSTPVVGMVVLAWALWLKLSGASSPPARRAVWFSLLALAAPVWLLLMQVVLSGFSR